MSQLTDFINHIKKNNIARTNRYRITFSLPEYVKDVNAQRILSLTCLIADVPGYQEKTSEQAYGSMPRRTVYGRTQGEFTTTFLVTGNYDEKKLFDNWRAVILNDMATSIQYYDQYISHITVDCLNEQDQVIYTFSLTEAYPTSVSPLKLDRTAQNQQMVLDVTWAYHMLKNDEENKNNRGSTVNPILGTAAGAAGIKRLLPIPGLDSFSAGVKSAMDTVKGFREQVSGALKIATDIREQVRDAKMQVLDGIKVLNGVVKDVRAIRNIPLDVKNEVAAVINDTKNQLGSLKADTKLIASPFPKR